MQTQRIEGSRKASKIGVSGDGDRNIARTLRLIRALRASDGCRSKLDA